MKIVFTARGFSLDAEMDVRFGRACGFFLFDEETGAKEWIENAQNVKAAHGAGIQAAATVINAGADILVTGHVGPKAFSVLFAKNIDIFTGAENMTVKEAYEQYKNGVLKKADKANEVGLG